MHRLNFTTPQNMRTMANSDDTHRWFNNKSNAISPLTAAATTSSKWKRKNKNKKRTKKTSFNKKTKYFIEAPHIIALIQSLRWIFTITNVERDSIA